MKKYVTAASALLIAMTICLTTSQATTHKQTPNTATATAQADPPQGMMGKVVAVDAAKSEVAVKDDKGGEKTMSIGPTTKITKDGKDIALSDVKAGDKVMFELDGASNPPVAKLLAVMTGKPAKP